MDEQTQKLLLPHNVPSDHKIIKSEFYAAQMCCIWSEPNLEKRIFEKRRTLIKELNDKYSINISQLPEEVSEFEEKFQKPIIFTESGIKTSIEILQKINVEAFNCGAFSLLYEKLYPKEQRNKSYGSWKSIKHMEALLLALYPNIKEEKKRELMSPLYLLNDFRIYYDHLVSTDKKNETKNNILNSLGLTDFSDLKTIYETIVNRLLILYDYYLTAL